MSGKIINFEDKKINKSNFYKNEKLFKIEDIDINNILVSRKESYGTKYSRKCFIGYNDNDVIKPSCIRLPQMIDYVKCFDSNKAIFFKLSDNKLLKKYNKIWEIVNNLLSIKKNKMENHINDDLDQSLFGELDNESDNEIDNEFENGSDDETDD